MANKRGQYNKAAGCFDSFDYRHATLSMCAKSPLFRQRHSLQSTLARPRQSWKKNEKGARARRQTHN